MLDIFDILGPVMIGPSSSHTAGAARIGFIAVALGAGNAAGGYVVTERMLDMFKSSKKPAGKEAKP